MQPHPSVTMTPLRWIGIGLLVAGCNSHAPAPAIVALEGYRDHQDVALASGGARLQLLEDERITPAIRATFQRGLPDDTCATPGTDSIRVFCATIARRPLRSAVLRLIDPTGPTHDSLALERPIADIVLVIPASDSEPAVYGVSVDLSAGLGSYSGPLLEVLDLHDHHLVPLRARDVTTDSLVTVFLPTTLKTAWQVVPVDGRAGPDILLVACRPTFETQSGGFQVTYTRFSREGTQWRRYARTAPGFWEDDGDFPARSLFP